MSTATEYRLAGVLLGCMLLLFVPGMLLGPVVFGSASFADLPHWALAASIVSAVLGTWHLVTAAFALDQDLALITAYAEALDAAPLVLPFSLFVGTRSVYRRLFAPAYIARLRWQARREARLHASAQMEAESAEPFQSTIPPEP